MKCIFLLSTLLAMIWPPFSLPSNDCLNHSVQTMDSIMETGSNLRETYVRSSHRGKVNVYNMKLRGHKFGNAIWMSRKGTAINAKYFAFKEGGRQSKSVYHRYQNWQKDKDIVLACSGAFSTELPGKSNKDALTVGLTVDNGRIVNRNIEYSMDGLAIVYATGGIVISDIENKNLNIGGKEISVIDDKIELLEWAKNNKATIFQTQLLAYENTLRISRAGRKNKRERRFLALARNTSGELFHIIFDVPENNYLFDASKEIFYFLSEDKNMDVTALLNLDTGAYNVLELYRNNKSRDFQIMGDTDIKISTNLIVYHLSE